MISVIALGNELRGDDGIGPRVLVQLKQSEYKERAHFIDAGADAFIVLDHLRKSEPVVIIDCAEMEKKAGDVIRFEAKRSNLGLMDQLISLHGFGLAEIYKMAETLGPVAPCTIIGIQPKSIEFNSRLSDEVEKSIPKIINLVIEEIKKNV